MAVTFQSVSAVARATIAASITVDKPSGLAVGDLMVAHLVRRDNDGTSRDFSRSGWTVITNTNANDGGGTASWTNAALYKVADAGDVAASNFAFTLSSTGDFLAGAIYRIDGQNSSPVSAVSTSIIQNSTSPSYTGITPDADSVFLFLVLADGGAATTKAISSQAITTSNPSWTEDYDSHNSTTLTISGAHSTRPQATATGNATFSISAGDGTTDSGLILLAIKNQISVTVTADVISTSASIQSPTPTGGSTVSPSVIATSASIQATTRSGQAAWSAQSKRTAQTLTASPKSSTSTFTASTKHAATNVTSTAKTPL
jgi:hypothetical protein